MSNAQRFIPRVSLRADAVHGRRSLCSLCDIRDWEDPEFQALAGRIMTGDPDCVFRHRKLWEFVRTVQSLVRGGVWNDEALGLSVAAGHERLLYFASNVVSRMVASDVYGDGDFISGEARSSFVDDPSAFAPYPFRKEVLLPVWMNALSLEFSEELFDFAFCLSSIEHFGGLDNARRSILEMARVVRPGGFVVVTTDYSLNGRTTNEVFSEQQLHALSRIPGLALLDPIDLSVSEESSRHLLNMKTDVLDVQPHINLRLFGAVFTSVSLVFRKAPGRLASAGARRAQLDHEYALLRASTEERRVQRAIGEPEWLRTLYLRMRVAGWRMAERLAVMRGEFPVAQL